MKNEEIVEKIIKITEPYVEKMNLSLVDVEYLQEGGYFYVRVFIENLNGDLNIEDCSKLSSKIEDQVEAIVDNKFFLEVSSPGLERPLKKIKDYDRFKNEKITLQLKKKLNEKKKYIAIIREVDFENEVISFEIDNEKVEINYKDIKKSNILFEFSDF